jgi:hypothetical protein
MTREQRIQHYGKGFYWNELLKNEFSKLNYKFEEIVLIEELIPFERYRGFARIHAGSNKNKFILVSVSFNKRARPYISFSQFIFNSVFTGKGKILLNKLLDI